MNFKRVFLLALFVCCLLIGVFDVVECALPFGIFPLLTSGWYYKPNPVESVIFGLIVVKVSNKTLHQSFQSKHFFSLLHDKIHATLHLPFLSIYLVFYFITVNLDSSHQTGVCNRYIAHTIPFERLVCKEARQAKYRGVFSFRIQESHNAPTKLLHWKSKLSHI